MHSVASEKTRGSKADPSKTSHLKENRTLLLAAWLSLVVGIVLLAVKFFAYELTGSQAVFSDASESIVNVITAITALITLRIAVIPADRNHPYGHGKAEYFSAVFEGGLLAFAGALILIEASSALVSGSELKELNLGLVLVLIAGAINGGLGLFLQNVGKKNHSATLVASGKHIFSDCITSAGVLLGLILVKLTGVIWFDPITAMIVAVLLLKEGWSLVRGSAAGLMDEQDRDVIKQIGHLFDSNAFPGIIRIHHTRIIRSGAFHHINAHVVVPEYWSVEEAHEKTNQFARQVVQDHENQGEIHFHVDPCRQAYCKVCSISDCKVRREPFAHRIPFSIDELTSPTEPEEFRKPGKPLAEGE